ncbi:hypothetical protein C8R46DRAFT_1023972 [Mycena filopes]|nr:hypothetical protein C8R46DRAFT_1023972 [Mycena filopes]
MPVGKAAPVAPGPSRRSPLLAIPTEIGLEIMEFALLVAPATALAVVSKQFHALVCKIFYKTVTLDRHLRIVLFHRTVRNTKGRDSSHHLLSHVRTLALTSRLDYTSETRTMLEEIVGACTALRVLVLPRPGILAAPVISGLQLVEVTLQKFDAETPFEWDPQFAQAVDSPAAPLCQKLTHLRVCEPGSGWNSPFATLEFFGALQNLTHLALARRVSLRSQVTPNDGVFVREIRAILASRPALQMLVVSVFPARWPNPTRALCSLCSADCICRALSLVAEVDSRLVVLFAGWNTLVEQNEYGFPDFISTSPPAANHGRWRSPGSMTFWENWRISDKRIVSLTAGWEPEILQGAVPWTYFAVGDELRGGHDFWKHWAITN